MDSTTNKTTAAKFYIYIPGAMTRDERVYFETSSEARRAIRELPASQRRIATVERAEF